jgi:hypothetical protein
VNKGDFSYLKSKESIFPLSKETENICLLCGSHAIASISSLQLKIFTLFLSLGSKIDAFLSWDPDSSILLSIGFHFTACTIFL